MNPVPGTGRTFFFMASFPLGNLYNSSLNRWRRVIFLAFFFVFGTIALFGFSQTAYAACAQGDFSCGHWDPGPGATYTKTVCVEGFVDDDETWVCTLEEDREFSSAWVENIPSPLPLSGAPAGSCTCTYQTDSSGEENCSIHITNQFLGFVTENFCYQPPICQEASILPHAGWENCGEWTQNPQCYDNLDNDGNGLVDYPNDLGCTSKTDPLEAAELPNLIATTATASTAVVGSATTFSATVTNNGNATASNFPNMFQIENVTLVSAQTIATLGAGASNGISASYSLPVGSYRVRD